MKSLCIVARTVDVGLRCDLHHIWVDLWVMQGPAPLPHISWFSCFGHPCSGDTSVHRPLFLPSSTPTQGKWEGFFLGQQVWAWPPPSPCPCPSPRCHVRLDVAAECAQSPPTSPVSTPWPGGPFFCVSQMAAVSSLLLCGHLALPRPLPPPWHYSLCRSDGNLTIRWQGP